MIDAVTFLRGRPVLTPGQLAFLTASLPAAFNAIGPRPPRPVAAKAPVVEYRHVAGKAPCPCGSGLPFKKCHKPR